LLHGADGRWTGRWSLYHAGSVEHWSSADVDWRMLLSSGIDGTADRLAARHARIITAESRRFVDIVVTDIRGVDGYQRARKYLQELDPVESLQVVGLEENHVRFRLALSGDSGTLVRLIGFGSALVPVPVVPGRPLNGPDRDGIEELSYRLLP
jgi:hypothetical protein